MGDRTCGVLGCEARTWRRNWCCSHYNRWLTHGDPLGGQYPRGVDERFWAKVDADGDCWEWTGYRTAAGYGEFWRGRPEKAHRVSYELLVGEIPDGLQIDHLCRNRCCVNPDHLEPVTQIINGRRGYGACAQHARQKTCRHGHPFAGPNLYVRPSDGARMCRACLSRQAPAPRESRKVSHT